MSFGYIGDTSTSVKQQVKNKGILTTQESFDLERQGFLGGSLELIEEQTVSGVSTVDFTSIQEQKYDVHFLTFNNVTPTVTGSSYHNVRFSNDGGSTYENSTNYDYANQYGGTSAGDFNELKSATATEIGDIFLVTGTDTEIAGNGYMYFYNLGNSSKYSFTTHQTMTQINSSSSYMYFGGGVYHIAETINAIRWFSDSSRTFNGNFKLYGVKQI